MKLTRKTRRRLLKILACGGLASALVWFAVPFLFSLPTGLTEAAAVSPVFLDRHGEPISHLALPDATRSQPIALEEIPQDFIDCTLAAEDKRFFQHGGIDLLATAASPPARPRSRSNS